MKTCFQVLLLIVLFLFTSTLSAQNLHELRKLTNEDWLEMSTEERLSALNTSNNHAQNQTFTGNFGRNYDLYPKWGYDYYEMNDRYENYAFRGFENYYVIEDRRNRWYYNQFGDRLTKMTKSAKIWSETHNDDGTSSYSGPSGYINEVVGTDGIWVARESTDDWAISAVGATAVRMKLTPLTTSIPNITGVKVDFQSANYQASAVNSILIGSGAFIDPFARGQNTPKTTSSLMLRALQFRRKIGALTLGTTYANMYSAQGTRDGGADLKGTVSDYDPTPILYAVRIVDDSPHDGNGPIVHDVKLKVDGVYRPDIQPLIIIDNLKNERITAVSTKSEKNYLEPGYSYSGQALSFDQLTIDERLPKYLDYLYINDYMRGWNTKTLTDNFDIETGKKYYRIIDPGGKPVEVNGNEYVAYIFDLGSITDRVKRVEVDVTVANDYRIQTSQIYTKDVTGGHDPIGENFLFYNAQYWRTMAQADGNIKDGSNIRTISIDFGYEVGNVMYGFDAHFNYLGFRVNGEFVTNSHFFMFSDGIPATGLPPNPPTDINSREGHHSSQTDHAYYITIQKDWSRFGFAGEYFKMGKFYRPYMNYFIPSEIAGNTMDCRNDTVRMTMIEDNDDDDQYPDTQFQSRAMGWTIASLTDPDGVFPGNDLDHDGYPDNEKNDNGLPDYDEPFLMFDVDPDEYVFGDDFNNNTIPDFREDDMKYDTPYDLDRQGRHLYFRFSPQENVNLFIGSLRTKGVGLDNRTYDDYFKTNFNYDILTVGKIYAEYRYERVQDNIQDKFCVVPTKTSYFAHGWHQYSRYSRDLYYDEVEYRNSKVQKLFLDSRIRVVPSITLENHVKFEKNKQLEGTMYDNTFQPKDIVSTFAMINKFIYTKQWRNWTFSPGLKFRLYKKDRSNSLNPLDHYMMRIPIVYLKYRVSDSTNITYGVQGFKGFEMLYHDYIQSHNDYKQVNYILQVENRSSYFGFEIWGSFGFNLEQIKYFEKYRNFEEYKSSSVFVKMYMGY